MSVLCQLEVRNGHGLDTAVGKASVGKAIHLSAAASFQILIFSLAPIGENKTKTI